MQSNSLLCALLLIAFAGCRTAHSEALPAAVPVELPGLPAP